MGLPFLGPVKLLVGLYKRIEQFGHSSKCYVCFITTKLPSCSLSLPSCDYKNLWSQWKSLKRHFKHQSNSSTVMPMEEPWSSSHMWRHDTAAARPTVTVRGFSISRDAKTWENVYLRTDDSVCWRERQSQKITIYRVRGSLTCIIWADNKQDVFQEPRRKSGNRSKEKNIVCLK